MDEVVAFWLRHGVEARVYDSTTSRTVSVSSRLLGSWWIQELGLGRNSYEQRLPDLIWDRSSAHKWALLSGLWEGDGSWSPVRGGPSVVLEYGTISDELADGVLRLLGDLGVVAGAADRANGQVHEGHPLAAGQRRRPGGARDPACAGARSPRRAGPDRLARASASLPPAIAVSTPVRPGREWCPPTATPFSGSVYSLEVPGAHTFVTTGSAITHNCFPKDVQALKQLAGNTGYHFQLLTAVIEVNELQKRRTIGKLQKHLGSLVGKEIALLGVAFKPNTDDIREATSLVLAGRLQGEGAQVRVYDPVATDRAHEQLGGALVAATALEALDGADAVVLVTEWPEFRDLDWAGEVKDRLKSPVVVDGRNFLDREALRRGRIHLRGRRALDVQALVLAGGEGTRLRPLTYTTPKAVMPLAGRPFLSFMLDWLHGHGVDDVVLSCGFLSADVRRVLGDIYQGMRLRYVVEEEPLGTAGPVRLALDEGILEGRLVVANGDVLTDLDLSAELAWHEERGARATLGLVAVEDTSSYGVVPTDAEGRVEAFLEKSDERAAHRQDQRRGLRAGARRDRGHPGRAGRCRSSARSSRRSSASRCTATRPRRPTGSTSGRPSATWRPPGTCSPAACRRACRAVTRPARSCSTARSWPGPTWDRRPCSGAAARWAPTPAWSAPCCTIA